MTQIRSFDIFDTVLVRTWAKPEHVLEAVGHKLEELGLISMSADAWYALRAAAEKTARRRSPKQDIPLLEIYQYLAKFLYWSDDKALQAMNLEIQFELSSLQSVPVQQKLIQSLHQKGECIIYISDMYLPKDVVKEALKQNNIWSEGDILYVSSDSGALKATGKLFEVCLQEQGISPKHLFHTGDNFRSDVKKAQEVGIKAQLFTPTHLNRYEKWIANQCKLSLKFRSMLSGSSRLSRLNYSGQDGHKQKIWDTSVNVVAPVLVGFVHWCLEEASKLGLKRLYFLARDGQILLMIAQILCRKWGYKIDCRYLYASRQAWHFPSIESLENGALDWIFEMPAFPLSVRSACEGVNIEPEEIGVLLKEQGFLEENWDQDLSPQDRDRLRQAFSETEIAEKIIAVANQYFESTLSYFKQEAMGDDKHFGLVDIGWKGSLQNSLQSLLSRGNIESANGIYGFYFGLLKRSPNFSSNQLLAYFHDAGDAERSDKIQRGYRRILEIFVAADHGSTMKYMQQDNNRMVPIFHHEKNDPAVQWGLETLQQAAVNFTEHFTDCLQPEEVTHADFLTVSEFLLDEFINRPTRDEAKAFGLFQDSPHTKEEVLYELAPKIHLRNIWTVLAKGQELSPHAWQAGVIARNHPFMALLYVKAKSLRKKGNRWSNKLTQTNLKTHHKN